MQTEAITQPDLLIERITDLPALPFVVAQSLSLMESDTLSADMLAQTLESDHALTAKILRVANSAFYGLPQEIFTVRDAIIVVGFEAVRSVAISAAAISGLWVHDELFIAHKFWMHSLGCALFSEAVAKRLRNVKPEAAFTLGILHDVGRIVLIQHLPEKYREVMELMKSKRMYLWKAELEVLGFHHGEIGSRLADRWHLPPVYSEAIRYHHEPEAAEKEGALAHLLALCDSMSHTAYPVDRLDRFTQPLYRGLWEPLKLDEATIRSLLNKRDSFHERSRSFIEIATTR
jgi:putative nucleotidyltransferase with HDIG domain